MVLVKKYMLRYEQDVNSMRGMGRGLSDHQDVLSKFRLMVAWIKMKEVVDGDSGIKSEKPRKHQHRERYDRSLEKKIVD